VSVGKPSESTSVWDGILNEEPTPPVDKLVKARLAAFDRHKKALLDRLSKKRDPKSEPFDEEKWWRRLTRLAQAYFLWRTRPPGAKREKELRNLAKTLGRACNLVEKARQNNVGSELVSQLLDGVLPRDPRGQIVLGNDGSLRAVYFPEINLKEIVLNLETYQAAVLRAANDIPTRQPGKLPALPRSYIRALADVYQESTGWKPGAGSGPFYRFVAQFRAALDPSYHTTDENGDERVDDSVIDAIQDALRKPRGLEVRGAQQVNSRRRSKK
jgi:hypothetical protein